MPKALIVYFSQGGTTARVAESIAIGLRNSDYQVELYNLKDAQPPDPEAYDLLGVGSPTYYFRLPFNVTDYVSNLPDLAGLPVFTFVLYGTYRFDTGETLQRILVRRGAGGVSRFHCRGSEAFLGYCKEGFLFSPGHPTAEELIQAESFGLAVAANPFGQTYTKSLEDRPPSAVYRLERLLLCRWLARHLYSRQFTVRASKCTTCGICERECPTGNITIGKKNLPVWGRNCLMCLYCQLKCPEEAITSPVNWPLFRPFMLYNLRRASRDPMIDFAHVTHSQGHTRSLQKDI